MNIEGSFLFFFSARKIRMRGDELESLFMLRINFRVREYVQKKGTEAAYKYVFKREQKQSIIGAQRRSYEETILNSIHVRLIFFLFFFHHIWLPIFILFYFICVPIIITPLSTCFLI